MEYSVHIEMLFREHEVVTADTLEEAREIALKNVKKKIHKRGSTVAPVATDVTRCGPANLMDSPQQHRVLRGVKALAPTNT